jgi:hypothetical protein
MPAWVDVTADEELLGVLWADAPQHDAVLAALLTSAQRDCMAFLEVPTDTALSTDTFVAASWKQAVIVQARGRYRSLVAGGAENIGADFPVTVHPLDWAVKQLLKPKSGKAGIW